MDKKEPLEETHIQLTPEDNSPEDVQRFKDKAGKYRNMDCDFCYERKSVIYGMRHEPYGDVLGICADCIPINQVWGGYGSD